MDDVVNRMARELSDAIAAAVADDPRVEACRERARAAGFELKVSLEAVIGFVNRTTPGALAKLPAPQKGAPRRRPSAVRNQRQRSPLPAFAADRRGRNPGKRSRIAARTSRATHIEQGPSLEGPFSFPGAALLRDARGRFLGGLGVAEVVVAQRLQLLVELVDERDAGRDVELDDLVVADVVEILHQRAQAVAVRRDQHALAAVDRRARSTSCQ